jgi:cytoskeleton protein RodZ
MSGKLSMSDEEQTSLLKMADTEASGAPLSAAERAGALLRVSREAAGFSLEALAAVVKVPVRKLEALEAGRLDALPESVYVRGIVVGICRVLHADPQEILALLPLTPAKPLQQQGAIAPVPFQTVGDDSLYSLLGVIAKPYVRWALTIVLGAALLYLWPDIASLSRQVTADVEVLPVSQPWVANGTVASVPEQLTGSVPTISEAVGEVYPSTALTPVGDQASAAAKAALVPAEETVHFKARGKTWVEVIDGKGMVVLRRVLTDGEQTGGGGLPPLAVVVGNADVTEVWVRGKVFEIKSISQGNVARFEVK